MSLKDEIKKAHQRTSRSESTDLISTWNERELLDGELKDVFSVIFRTKGCGWAYETGCSMCGYYTDTNPNIDRSDLESQIDDSLSEYEGEEIVKIYTSGSFLDPREIDKELGQKVLKSFDAEKVVVESRPEFIDKELVKDHAAAVDELELAIGLESANDFVLDNCINKGFSFKDYKDSIEDLPDEISIRTYLLLKPPFLSEKEAIEDLTNSIEKIKSLTDIVSINPVNVQKGSLVEKLWHRDLYTPPSLWSIVEVLSNVETDIPIFVSNAGLGSERGASNCDECTDRVIEVIEKFNKSQNKKKLDKVPDCQCRPSWKKEKNIESYLNFRGAPKILRDRYAGYL